MLELENIYVSTGGREILRDINLRVNAGETAVLFGPNGSGKTTLLNTIMGIPPYLPSSGNIQLNGKNITTLDTDERARMGIGISFQKPPVVRGVKLGGFLDAISSEGWNSVDMARRLNLGGFLTRDLNNGYSGGEIKRSELLQLQAQSPSFVMFDEPDSGVDLVSIKLIGRMINEMLHEKERAGLLITHAGYILDYVDADIAYVMIQGHIMCAGKPKDILKDIREIGYKGCAHCQKD
ncbi:ABC transporter ATP-binding protein [Nitrospirota bacterium]